MTPTCLSELGTGPRAGALSPLLTHHPAHSALGTVPSRLPPSPGLDMGPLGGTDLFSSWNWGLLA